MFSTLLVVLGMLPFIALTLYWVHTLVQYCDDQGALVDKALKNSPLQVIAKRGLGCRIYSFDFESFSCQFVVHPRGTDGPHGLQLKFGNVDLMKKRLFLCSVTRLASFWTRFRFLNPIESLPSLPQYKLFSNDKAWANRFLSSEVVDFLEDLGDWPIDLNLKDGRCCFSVWKTMESSEDCEKFIKAGLLLLERVASVQSRS